MVNKIRIWWNVVRQLIERINNRTLGFLFFFLTPSDSSPVYLHLDVHVSGDLGLIGLGEGHYQKMLILLELETQRSIECQTSNKCWVSMVESQVNP